MIQFELDLQPQPMLPRRLQWNGCVERANRSARIEFWKRHNGPTPMRKSPLGSAS